MNKNCILVLNAYPDPEINKNSIESIRIVAKRWNSDFIEINYLEDRGNNISTKLFFTRFEIIKKFSFYNKILILDSDIIINSKSPNIFDELEEYELAGVLDGNPSRFPNNWVKETIVRNIINYFNFESFSDILQFDQNKYFHYYLNSGVIMCSPSKIKNKLETFLDILEQNPKILIALESSLGDQNLANVFFSNYLNNIKILNNKWNWIMPDAAGKNGWILDQFDPSTGELIDWEKDSDTPPDWTDNLFRGSMHPYIYHFCGTENAKEICKTYSGWR